jgi:hypothetical protein
MHSEIRYEEDTTRDIQVRMEEILDSIPSEGSNPETEALVSGFKDKLFPVDYMTSLKEIGLDVEKISSFVSKKKLEIVIAIKYPDTERQMIVRYRKGESASIRLTTGVVEGEKVLYEETLSGPLDQVVQRVRNVVEGLAPKK